MGINTQIWVWNIRSNLRYHKIKNETCNPAGPGKTQTCTDSMDAQDDGCLCTQYASSRPLFFELYLFVRSLNVAVVSLTRPALFETLDSAIFISNKQWNSKAPTLNKILYIHKITGSTLFVSGVIKNRKNKKKSFSCIPKLFMHVSGYTAFFTPLLYHKPDFFFKSYQILIMLMSYKHDWRNWKCDIWNWFFWQSMLSQYRYITVGNSLQTNTCSH